MRHEAVCVYETYQEISFCSSIKSTENNLTNSYSQLRRVIKQQV